jgi:hypothetical protein
MERKRRGPPRVELQKPCAWCGATMRRRRSAKGRSEDIYWFNKRRFCSSKCYGHHKAAKAAERRAKDERAYRRFVGPECEACGATTDLHVHHIDGEHANGSCENMQTLCRYCHGFWHGLLKRKGVVIRRMPKLL